MHIAPSDPMLRALAALALLAALASAAQLCLEGEAPLSLGVGVPETAACSGADCTLRWALSFDTVTVGTQRWPLEASVNGTALSTLYPALVDVAIQCSTSGELIATTATGPGGERLRLVWTYAGVSTFSCAYMLGAVDLQSDFRNFQALLAYSGHIASFDATFSSQSFDYSVASAERPCGGAPTSGGVDGGGTGTPPSCIVGACRHPAARWRGLAHSPVWATMVGGAFCSLSYEDIVWARGGAKFMPVRWLQEAQALVAAIANAHLYGCDLPTGTDAALASSYAYLSNPLNCALNLDRSAVVEGVAAFNDGELACAQTTKGADADGSTPHANGASAKTQQAYLIWAIVMTVAFVLVMMALAVLAIMFGPQLLRSVSGGAAGGDGGGLVSSMGAGIGAFFSDGADDVVEASPLASSRAPAPLHPEIPLSPMATHRPQLQTSQPQAPTYSAPPAPTYASSAPGTLETAPVPHQPYSELYSSYDPYSTLTPEDRRMMNAPLKPNFRV